MSPVERCTKTVCSQRANVRDARNWVLIDPTEVGPPTIPSSPGPAGKNGKGRLSQTVRPGTATRERNHTAQF
jgi:hypothetical protein